MERNIFYVSNKGIWKKRKDQKQIMQKRKKKENDTKNRKKNKIIRAKV